MAEDIPQNAVNRLANDVTENRIYMPPGDQHQLTTNGSFPMVTDTSFTNGNASILHPALQSSRSAGEESQTISADEIALYDRQIRLWGIKAQEKLGCAKILLIGIKALANEVAKNLVLAGVGSLTVLDHEQVTESDLYSQFLISDGQIGQFRAEAALPQIQKLNPRVALFSDTQPVGMKLAEYFSSFDITIATNLDITTLSNINAACRIYNRKFYAADIHGMYGYIFADLIVHDFVIERGKSNKPTALMKAETPTRTTISASTKRENGKVVELVTKRETYSPIILANTAPLPADINTHRRRRLQVTPLVSCVRALFEFQKMSGGRLPIQDSRADLISFTEIASEKHRELQLPTETLSASFLRSFLQGLGSELTPVAAFVGGALAQDVINVLGQREQPLQNFLFFDGEESKGPIYSMHPYFDAALPDQPFINLANGTATLPSSAGLSNGEDAAPVIF